MFAQRQRQGLNRRQVAALDWTKTNAYFDSCRRHESDRHRSRREEESNRKRSREADPEKESKRSKERDASEVFKEKITYTAHPDQIRERYGDASR